MQEYAVHADYAHIHECADADPDENLPCHTALGTQSLMKNQIMWKLDQSKLCSLSKKYSGQGSVEK